MPLAIGRLLVLHAYGPKSGNSTHSLLTRGILTENECTESAAVLVLAAIGDETVPKSAMKNEVHTLAIICINNIIIMYVNSLYVILSIITVHTMAK